MAAWRKDVVVLLACVAVISPAQAFIEGLYCGTDNCYDLLGVTRASSKSEITKAYRKMARKWHPDMHRKKTDKEEAQIMFQKIANAYEVLKDEDTKKDYDYMLDNPEEYYYHYFNYYRRRMAPKVDVRIVIAVTISVISVIQYWNAWNNYNTAISYLITVPKYRLKAMDIAKSEGMLNTKKLRGKERKSKEELREEEEAILKKVLQEKMDIRLDERTEAIIGGYSRPKITSILWLQIVLLPYTITLYIIWFVRWIWKFTILRQEYGEEEKMYLIRKYMGLSQSQWDSLEDHDVDTYLKQELWIKENFKEWKQIQDEEMKAKLADNARYKSYRRYMKNHGPGQISFGPE